MVIQTIVVTHCKKPNIYFYTLLTYMKNVLLHFEPFLFPICYMSITKIYLYIFDMTIWKNKNPVAHVYNLKFKKMCILFSNCLFQIHVNSFYYIPI